MKQGGGLMAEMLNYDMTDWSVGDGKSRLGKRGGAKNRSPRCFRKKGTVIAGQ